MSRIQSLLWAAAALAAVFALVPGTAQARGPIRYLVARPVVRTPVAVIRTARVVAPPYYARRVYVAPPVYVAPIGGTVVYIP